MREEGVPVKTKNLISTALCSAISFLLMLLSFPFFAAPFLKVEFSEVPILVAGVFLSPLWGLAAQAIKDFLMLTLGGATPWGVLSDFVCGGTLMAVFALLWRKMPAAPLWKRGTAAGALGIAARCLIAIPLNYWILGIEFGRSVSEVSAMLLPIIIPFNAFKSLCNILVFLALYQPFARILAGRRAKA